MSDNPSDRIADLFDRIAPVYDDLNQVLSLGQHRIWKRMAVKWAEPRQGDRALDLCCGSGDVAAILAEKVGIGGHVEGADFAGAQLEVARQKYPTLTQITWTQADALHLPYADNEFDCATLSYGLRNLIDIPAGLCELARVLKPNALAAILDMHRPDWPIVRTLQQWYLDAVVVPAAARLGFVDEYAYIAPSLDRFPVGATQVQMALASGFSQAIHYPIASGTMGVLVVRK